MAYNVIDRRANQQKGKSSGNRRRFIRRVKKQLKEATADIIRDGKIEGIAGGEGRKVSIPKKDLKEYQIGHSPSGGERNIIHTGNKEFSQGDRINRPEKGGGKGNKGSQDGEGEDDFTFELTKDEFLELFFEDLELPDLIKQSIKAVDTWNWNRAGFVNDGTPARMNIERSMRKAKGRRSALRGPKKKKLKKLEAELEQLNITITDMQSNGQDCTIEKTRRTVVEHEIKVLKRKIKAVPFIDEIDLQYNHWEKQPVPTTKAVMFCIMDVSGSMGEWEKEMSKRFFMLLYLFLTKAYEKVELVFIRHHSIAKEVDEDEFFHSKETGGTVVSCAIDLMDKIIKERYDVNSWNIYACQASDGDNWSSGDNALVRSMLESKILPAVQYYAYVEIKDNKDRGSDLWDMYNEIQATHTNFATSVIHDAAEIYPVFRKLFEKEKASGAK